MSTNSLLQRVELLIVQDPSQCIKLVSDQAFINTLELPHLKQLLSIIDQAQLKKGIILKADSQSNSGISSQVVVTCYCVIIMRWAVLNSTQKNTSDHQGDQAGMWKTTVEALTRILKSGSAEWMNPIITGLLLRLPSPKKNYKLLVKHLNPDYISEETMDLNFEAFRKECGSALEQQIIKYRTVWSKYLRYRDLTLKELPLLVEEAKKYHHTSQVEKMTETVDNLSEEFKYLHSRLSTMATLQETQKVDLDDITTSLSQAWQGANQSMRGVTRRVKQGHDAGNETVAYQCYLRVQRWICELLSRIIGVFGSGWLRKIKWLSEFVTSILRDMRSPGVTVMDSRVAEEQGKLMLLAVKITREYLQQFGMGLMPGCSEMIIGSLETSVYKLVEALLYNDYPWHTGGPALQNYQKGRKPNQNKAKQNLIDTLRFSSQSLNINPHWDNIFTHLIPAIVQPIAFATQLTHQSLKLMQVHLSNQSISADTAKLILMLANAKLTAPLSSPHNQKIISDIKALTYPHRNSAPVGIEYFCEQYFRESLRRSRAQPKSRQLGLQHQVAYAHSHRPIRKTESRDAMALEGWEEPFESVRQLGFEDQNNGSQMRMKPNQSQVHSQLFYSVGAVEEVEAEKQREQPVKQDKQEQILLPEF